MLIDPRLNEVVAGPRGMLAGIQACINTRCLVSSVTLMFATVDGLAALARPVGQRGTSGRDFQAWTDRFLQPQQRIACTSLDLWGARCGVVHTYSPESTTAADQGARQIYYQWRAGPAANTRRQLAGQSLVVCIEDLHHAVVAAAHAYVAAAPTDPDLRARLQAHLPNLLCYVPHPAPASPDP